MAEAGNWSIGLFEVGDIGSCLYSWFCGHCALAESRTNMDQSSCLFNCCTSRHPIVYRWLMRSAYGIPGDWINDCLVSCCCCCCSVNQM